jgi:23S rRNA pseudouridine2605 synthase
VNIRLHKYLADCGVASRRKCEEMMAAGRVSVNGVPVTEPGASIDPLNDAVMVEGRPVNVQSEKIYILMNKPRGVITSTADSEGRKTVTDVLGSFDFRVYPVGRLDFDTEGVLVLTNDGELANILLHPSSEIWKVYEAKVHGIPGPGAVARLKKGILMDEGPTAPARARVVETTGKNAWLLIELTGGRYHQVKRMCESVGFPVVKLRRIEFAGLRCDGMSPGEWRYLKPKEIGRLWALAKAARAAANKKREADSRPERLRPKKPRPRARRYDERNSP